MIQEQGKNRWGCGYFEFNGPKTSTSVSTESKRQRSFENVSSTEENEVARPTASFPIVDLEGYDIAEKANHYIQVNHIIENPKIVIAEAEQTFKKAEFNFMMDLKTLIHETSVDAKLLQLEIYLQNI